MIHHLEYLFLSTPSPPQSKILMKYAFLRTHAMHANQLGLFFRTRKRS